MPVSAANIRVGGGCTLAEAIANANNDNNGGGDGNGCTAGSGNDTITLTGNIALTATLPLVTSNITIEGGGYTLSGTTTLLEAGHPSSTPITLTIKRLTVTNNNSVTTDDPPIRFFREASLIINDSLFKDNSIGNFGTGGAIEGTNSAADLTVSNSIFRNNTAAGQGGAIYFAGGTGDTLTISDSEFSGNQTEDAVGGAVRAHTGTVIIRRSLFKDNETAERGGAVSTGGGSSISIYQSVFGGNEAKDHGGAVESRGTCGWKTAPSTTTRQARKAGHCTLYRQQISGM